MNYLHDIIHHEADLRRQDTVPPKHGVLSYRKKKRMFPSAPRCQGILLLFLIRAFGALGTSSKHRHRNANQTKRFLISKNCLWHDRAIAAAVVQTHSVFLTDGRCTVCCDPAVAAILVLALARANHGSPRAGGGSGEPLVAVAYQTQTFRFYTL